jgi:cytochrome c biogenesis protein
LIQNTKCECGHQNHVGTVLCESCGKPLYDTDETDPLEMRYDGVSRRSQRENPGWIDRVWNFFSSVKIAVLLILFTLCGSAIGTVLPQENSLLEHVDRAKFYANNYGTFGTIYYTLGLSDTFNSWWFKALLVMIGVSLVVCSLDRVLPLYRALSKQQIRKHLQFLRRQKVVYTGELALLTEGERGQSSEVWVQRLSEHLRKRRYRIHLEGSAMLAEKHRFSRWGPYINHIGLIIFLLAVLMRGIPGWYMDEYMGLLEGETKRIPGTSYFLKNEDFIHEVYGKDELSEEFQERNITVDKLFLTKAVLYECTADCDNPTKQPLLKEVERHDIIVNHPLRYEGLHAYQFHYEQTVQLISVNAELKNVQNGQSYGKFKLRMKNPEELYELGPYTVRVINYYPEFAWKDGEATTLSREPRAPAFVFSITGRDLPEAGEVYIYFPQPIDQLRFNQDAINGKVGSRFDIGVASMEDVERAEYTSYLNIRIDRALPYIFIGAGIFMIGVVMGLYWQHRRIWLRIDGSVLTLGAHTNKNWYGLRHEVAAALNKEGIAVEPKSLENGVKPIESSGT